MSPSEKCRDFQNLSKIVRFTSDSLHIWRQVHFIFAESGHIIQRAEIPVCGCLSEADFAIFHFLVIFAKMTLWSIKVETVFWQQFFSDTSTGLPLRVWHPKESAVGSSVWLQRCAERARVDRFGAF
jgi:hypothetical protein